MTPATEVLAVSRAVAARYRDAPRFDRIFVSVKLRTDPLTGTLLALGRVEPFGEVADVGCGRGQFAIALLHAGIASSVTGLDWNTAQLGMARRAGDGLAFTAEARDLSQRSCALEVDTVLIADVLYQLDTPSQSALIAQAARSARSRIVIRTADPSRGWRSKLTRGLEIIGRRVWPNAGRHVNARPLGDLIGELDRAGFTASVVPCWKGTPFSNVVIDARRRPGAGSGASPGVTPDDRRSASPLP